MVYYPPCNSKFPSLANIFTFTENLCGGGFRVGRGPVFATEEFLRELGRRLIFLWLNMPKFVRKIKATSIATPGSLSRQRMSYLLYMNHIDMNIFFISCFKNEGWRIKEWIEFHSFLGVKSFILFDDHSEDDTLEIVSELSGKYDITISKTDGAGKYINSSNPNEYGKNEDLHTRLQRTYARGLNMARSKGANWGGVFDVDEYVVPTKKENCRKDYLCDYFSDKICPRIYVHSFDMLGPFLKGCKVTNATRCWSKDEKAYGQVNGVAGWFKDRGKSFINLSQWNGNSSCAHNISYQPCINEGDDTNLSNEHRMRCVRFLDNIRINHYRNHPLLPKYSDSFYNARIINHLINE